jgi:hypothetical protein
MILPYKQNTPTSIPNRTMARLFSLYISFEQKQYDAEVSVNDASDSNTISVYLLERSLHFFFPEGKMVFEV